MMKKLLSIALSLCMLLTMFSSVTVLANVEPDIVAEVVTSNEGDGSFTITFYSTSEKVEAFGVTVNFDATKYTLTTTKKSAVFNSLLEGTTSLNAQETKILFNWFSTYGGLKDKTTYNEDEDTYESLAPSANGKYEIAHISFTLNKSALSDTDYENKLKIDFEDYSFAAPTDTVPTVTYVEFNIPDTRTEIEGLTAIAAEGLKYTGTAFDAKTLITVNALETDTVEYTTVPAEVKNAGDYKVTATVKRAGYKPTAVSADVTIGKADTTITLASDEITYGETEYTKDFTVADGVDKAEITVSDYTVLDLNAGEKEITATATSTNYNVTVTPGTLTVNKADTTITIADAEITYGDTEYTKDFTVADGVDKAEISVSDYTVSDLNAGEKEITATATSANYNVTVTAGTLTVNKKPLTITAQNEFQVQGNGQIAEFKPAVVEGLVEGDEITNIVVGLKDAYTDAVGDYAIEVKSYDDNANYEITTVEGIYSIKTAIPVNVAFGVNKKTYGDADGDIVVTVTKGEDTADASSLVTITRKANEAAGTHADAYEVVLNVDTDEATGLPYALNITGNTYVIEPKAATINVANAEKKVGTVEDPAFSATYEGFLEGEEPAEITFTREAGETAGEYAITTAYADPNYAITVNNGTLTISKYALTVKAPTVTVKLGNAVPTLAAVIEGAADGDTITATVTVKNDVPEVVDPALIDTTVEAVYTTEATSDADLDKYDVTYVPGTLTVRKSSSRPSGGGVIKPATKPEEDKKDDEVKDDENKPAASANIALKEDAKDVNFVVADEENKFNPDVNASRNDVVAAISAIFDVTDVKNAPTFTDTEDEAIKALAAAGVIDGYTDGSFKGEKDITRAEFVKLLAAALKLEAVEGATANFSDIDSHWAAEWIKTFVSKGYLVGYPDGTFRPDNNITRAEMVVVITRVTDAVAGDAAIEFADVDASHWAYDYIMKAAK